MRRITTLAIGLLLALAAGGPATASNHGDAPSPPGHPACLPDAKVVDNEDVRIWFHGAKGQLQVHEKNDADGTNGTYQYQQVAVDEVGDDGTIATLNLQNSEPQTSSCTVEDEGNWVNVTYTVTDEVRADDGGLTGTADVTFVYHFNKSSSNAKFDLLVEQWPWQDDGQELAYDFQVDAGGWEIEPAENGLGFEDEQTGENEAFVEWAPNATATYEDGHQEEATVNSTVDASEHHADVTLAFENASPGYVELDYDPTVGVGSYLIVAGVLVPTADLPVRLPDTLYDTL